jgi:hypothetical protein
VWAPSRIQQSRIHQRQLYALTKLPVGVCLGGGGGGEGVNNRAW